jgi:hypothetical protein
MSCYDCGLPYEEMHDFLIPREIWIKISPTENDGSILCANCIVKRLEKGGFKDIPGAYMSGPIKSVSEETMDMILQLETIKRQFKRLYSMNNLKGALMYSVEEEAVK